MDIFLQILDEIGLMTHREGFVPVQSKVYRDMIFIYSESRFVGISVYRSLLPVCLFLGWS